MSNTQTTTNKRGSQMNGSAKAHSTPKESGGPTGNPPAKKSQKEMTKAERREMQERQRAAKAAATGANQQKGATGNLNSSAKAGPSSPTTSKKAFVAANNETSKSSTPATQKQSHTHETAEMVKGTDTRGLRIFSHFGLPKPMGHVKGDIHPVIIRLGLQFSNFKITGANARCIATLSAFKDVIQDYTTPANTTLSRHLMTYLSPQINHLVSARPMAVTMGNAIRQLKLEISNSDIDLPEQDAKDALCDRIDDYIRDKIIVADEVIQDTAVQKINNGDVILTYARSSIVEKVLLRAHAAGKQISVIVVDSRPMLEGKSLLTVLSSVGIPCTYLLLPALGSVITDASMVLLGAHSLHSNGAVYSRAGTALVSMLAKERNIPVLVCSETYKFSDSVQLDSFTKNELAPLGDIFPSFPIVCPQDSLSLTPSTNLEILNPLYDLTPPTHITAVVTEVGVIPPNSIGSIPVALGR